eukprot:gb/GEZN01016514.1/.p1 GENE.gb/GEZN01016514.1/~~gb/GEZN01016514.1/.p1  ORF type:complete len:145 (+),score=17.71 gb/GEZN01016514.1/:90-524(+)
MKRMSRKVGRLPSSSSMRTDQKPVAQNLHYMFHAHADAGDPPNCFALLFRPWCGHCKRMKPAWDDLGKAYLGSNVVVGDVDCTSDGGKALCESQGVRGYPTIKYFTAGGDADGQKYSGGRDLDSLKNFVKGTLGGVQAEGVGEL